MSSEFTVEQRRGLALAAGINEQYLYQCLTGRREMGAAEARRVEGATGGQLKPWQVCQRTWHLIWPELIGIEGAPEPTREAA